MVGARRASHAGCTGPEKKAGRGALDEIDEPIPMAERRSLGLARLGQALLGVLADRLEHADSGPRTGSGPATSSDRSMSLREQVDHLGRPRTGPPAQHLLGRFEREGRRLKTESAPSRRALLLGKEVEAPVDAARSVRCAAAPFGCRR